MSQYEPIYPGNWEALNKYISRARRAREYIDDDPRRRSPRSTGSLCTLQNGYTNVGAAAGRPRATG